VYLASRRGWGTRRLPHVAAREPNGVQANANVVTLPPADATLTECVQATIDALEVSRADSALCGLAFTMAEAIDGMDDELRAKMLGQSAGGLLRVLVELRQHARPKETPSWTDQHQWHAATPAAQA
jgi:hypothetical protein